MQKSNNSSEDIEKSYQKTNIELNELNTSEKNLNLSTDDGPDSLKKNLNQY